MSICGYGFNEPNKEICGDEVPTGLKYCLEHTYRAMADKSGMLICRRCGGFEKELTLSNLCAHCNKDELLMLLQGINMDEAPF